ncbi:RNase E specificity factor CsrD [Vibrio tapetis]|uniref:Putative EAL and GGDEF domains protein n=1 Tax=Vibrio tapetis subsp. tapetis TaxID=1671868 RepID=A0A2N8ZFJ4_9VIBR|nr:RNase E specificity factor CsrD [Vibrio tapetis]SON50692.1 putative EAL and GGDEF domains protein [Vibrio tapetis subsp. tapetis]
MRYTPTLKLSTRLVAFVTMIVVSAMFILFVGGTLSFKRIGQEYVNVYMSGIADVVDKEINDPEAAQSMAKWLPKILKSSDVIEMEITSSAGVIYHFRDTKKVVDTTRLKQLTFPLKSHPSYTVKFEVVPPYLSASYSMEAMSSITLAVALIIFCLLRGVKWLKGQLYGSELLEERGRMILAGRTQDHAKGDHREWPYTASEALDNLIEELNDARQERSRFDTFIRTHTFLDQLTGAANRVLFESKLESALQESGSHGGVVLLRIKDWEETQEQHDKNSRDQFIVDVGQILSNIAQRYPDVIFSRYYDADFAVLIPHQSSKDIAIVATQCLKQLEKLTLLDSLESDNWCHIGISMYKEGERRGYIIDEAETALKAAQMEQHNAWSRFSKKVSKDEHRGSVRWRTLFDKAFLPGKLLIFQQACFLKNENERTLLHQELFARIHDEQSDTIIKASRFTAAIEQVGYEVQMDRAVIRQVLYWFKSNNSYDVCYSINLNILPFRNKTYTRWFRDELLQLPTSIRHRLSFEFVEGALVKNLDYMRPVIRMISGLGCKVIVQQAGRTITSTHYIKDLEVDFLKLHRSLSKKIDQRQENQLFVRSLLGACIDSRTQVIAVGVETKNEWRTLKELGVDGGQGRLFDDETQLLPVVQAKKVAIGRRNRWRKNSK